MSDLVPLTGEPLALDLVNTRPTAGDLLASPGDLRSWWVLQADRLPEEVPQQVTAADLAAVRAVREHTARALDRARRGEEPAAADLEALNQAQRAAPAISEVAWNGSAVAATRRRDGSPGRRLAACLAEAAAELLADPAVTKIRECEAEDCVMLFLATHPRRRWCSAARCGNRVRVARHYQRHKAG
ncbi:CGNR zinc finger domain-containing protein [Streptomyces luteolifulvus]|jgi:predicted RNA-binding Zn ribbon-like protein|uniref:CGNR zinc finger domain-containing protein n=1 Tax=Streptomyces luteolifulvus TaxID=2615112 RepID=A0A6H9V0F4_9ACTN|nr:ABATE domain-containing protein [Streptomyces luteolifulvus]KAB1147170.1 CGNR zinc finger domain-containing protein [Streptomyces luteolifulvus]